MRMPSPPYCRLDLAPPLADRFIFGVAPIDYGPVLLLMPFGFHLTMDTLPSGVTASGGFRSALAVSSFRLRARLGVSIPSSSLRPARRYPRLWIRRSSSEHRRDFNPPEQCAAQRTLRSTPISSRSSHLASFPSLGGTAAAPWASFPQPQDATAAGQGLLTGLPHTGLIGGGDRTSQVPGEPHYERALLFDPGRTSALGHYRALILPSAFPTASAPARTVISGLNHTARSLAALESSKSIARLNAACFCRGAIARRA
jgi:hypothetical protein